MLRGALIGIIFNKTLLLRDGVFDESAAVTLMSTDVDRIALSMQSLNEVWGRLVEVSIGVWLLSVQLGAVSVVPIIVVLGKPLLHQSMGENLSTYHTPSGRCHEHSSVEIHERKAESLELSSADPHFLHSFHVKFYEKRQDDGPGRFNVKKHPRPTHE
jgi:hypothetical protein